MKQETQNKKAYTAPVLTTHGDIQTLTLLQVIPPDGSGPIQVG